MFEFVKNIKGVLTACYGVSDVYRYICLRGWLCGCNVACSINEDVVKERLVSRFCLVKAVSTGEAASVFETRINAVLTECVAARHDVRKST